MQLAGLAIIIAVPTWAAFQLSSGMWPVVATMVVAAFIGAATVAKGQE